MHTNKPAPAARAASSGRTSVRLPHGARRGHRRTTCALLIGMIAFGGRGHTSSVRDVGSANLMPKSYVAVAAKGIDILNQSETVEMRLLRPEISYLLRGQLGVRDDFRVECSGGTEVASVIVAALRRNEHCAFRRKNFEFGFQIQRIGRCQAEVFEVNFDNWLLSNSHLRYGDIQHADIGPKLPLGRAISSFHQATGGNPEAHGSGAKNGGESSSDQRAERDKEVFVRVHELHEQAPPLTSPGGKASFVVAIAWIVFGPVAMVALGVFGARFALLRWGGVMGLFLWFLSVLAFLAGPALL